MDYKILFEKILSKESQFDERIHIGKNGAQAFSCSPQKRKEKLWHIFGDDPNIPKPFIDAFDNAAHGFEKRRITQLNSSSLLALLCFWNVSKNNPILINGIKYTEVYFEVENEVFDHDSSVDILLVSHKESTWLYLESKFTEPLNPGNQLWLSEKYHNTYQHISDYLNLEISKPEKRKHKKRGEEVVRDEFKITQNRKRYYGGIKQMVSHIIGVLKGASDNARSEYREVYKKGLPKSILIGTILYDFTTTDAEEFKTPYKDYVPFYEECFSSQNVRILISKIKDCIEGICVNKEFSVSVLPTVLTYQDIFRKQNPNFLMSNVSIFYRI